MEFALFTRLASMIFTPGNFLILLLVAGAVLQETRQHRLGRQIVIAVAAVCAVIFLLPIDRWLARPLEDQFTRPPLPAHVDGILILSGGLDTTIFASRGIPAQESSDGRLLAGAELSRRYPGAKVIYSGGVAPLSGNVLPETTAARSIFGQMGVPATRIIWESRSRNTWENFVYSRQLAHPGSGDVWIVVTSALNMPRAMGIAAKLHWVVVPWPADYLTAGKGGGTNWNSGFAMRLSRIDDVMHEWIGIVAYRLTARLASASPR